MIQKYIYGSPFQTDAVILDIPAENGIPGYGTVNTRDGFTFTCIMGEDDIVYGLGEANRGINKRGYCYISDCTDDPNHTEDKRALYGAHNFIIIAGKQNFGLFFDYPARLTFDIGYTRMDTLKVSCENADLNLYVISGDSPYDIVKQFRRMIGRSYIPPKFAFGFGQSRWQYKTKEDFRKVAAGHRGNHVPLDMIYMDIDYMDSYKDFTLSSEFEDFSDFVREMRQEHIRLIPIIDAGVKIEEGYAVYEEGVRNRYFCQREDGSDFVAAVWPGDTHFPDFLNPDARKWFGDKYRFLTDQGIEGFWNDMNEPAIFYSKEGLEEARALAKQFAESGETRWDGGSAEKKPQDSSSADENARNGGPAEVGVWQMDDKLQSLANSPEDYRRFYHNINGKKVRHDRVHNLYGFNMTRAAGEAFERIDPGGGVKLFL